MQSIQKILEKDPSAQAQRILENQRIQNLELMNHGPTLSIQTLLERHLDTRSVISAPNSSKASIICDLVDFMEKIEVNAVIMKAHKAGIATAIERIKKKRSRLMKYWLGRTKHLEPPQIHAMISQAKKGRNPQALFNYLLGTSKPKHETHNKI